MLYYFGKGKEFKKEECKEYKTLDGARKAFDKAVAAGTEATVWDEKGVVVIGMTGNTGAGDGQQDNTGASGGGDSEQQGNVSESDTVIVPQGTMKVTVICDGTLNLRRSPHWGNTNVCGRASRGQSYYVKEIHTVDGKKMVRTIDDLYLSGASEHVQFEQL